VIGFILRRIGSALIVLFLLSLMVFAMVRVMPGDPAAALVDPTHPDPKVIAQIHHELGLDKPWPTQYFTWLFDVLRGNFGNSLTKPYGVLELLGHRLPVSLELAIYAAVLGILIGIPAGVLSARRVNGIPDIVARALTFVFIATPPFALGTMLILVNSLTLRIKMTGYVPLTEDPIGNLTVMFWPALLLGLVFASVLARYLRGTLLETFMDDYSRTARAKGALPSRIVWRHSLRNALTPVLTIGGIELAALVGGTVVIESVFSLPGIGTALVDAIRASDYTVIQAGVLLLGVVYIVINLVVDLLYPVVDPRIRVASS
jgi:peptide/nickel transport system permease protein